MKKIVLSLLLSLLSVCAFADGVTRVKNYRVDIVVHENNSFDVRENLTVHFAEPRHGFYRYVPYYYYHSDKKYKCDILNVCVEGDVYELSEENGNLLVRIGDEDRTVTGDMYYGIRYLLRNSDDREESGDWFFHSVLGNDLELPIDTIEFAIAFDKGLPAYAADSLKVMSGESGCRKNTLGADVWVKGDTIFGIATNIAEKNALTVGLPLPEGYYVGEKVVSPTLAYLFLAVVVIILLIIFYYEFTLRQPSITKHIEFYPPEGMCSAEIGTVIDDSVDNEDLASLIPWYANEGYISIEEKEEDGFFRKKKWLEITKLKDIPLECDLYKRTFFAALFSKSNEAVRLDKLPKMNEEMKSTRRQLERVFGGERKLTKWHWSVWLLLLLLVVSSCFVVAALPFDFMTGDDTYALLVIWGYPAIMGFIAILKLAGVQRTDSALKIWGGRLVRFVIMIGVMSLHLLLFDDLLICREIVIVVYVACFAAVEFSVKLNIDTEYRAELLGHLLGFKEFLKTAEEPRLKSLIENDKYYFYRILPYAMALKVSDVWAEHFDKIQMECPEAYHFTTTYGSTRMMSNFVSDLSSATNSAITCMSPSSSGSGGSGGGTGGGGGGAW